MDGPASITNAFTHGFLVPEILEMISSTDAKMFGYIAITESRLVSETKELNKQV